ncbi:uncharacterized protein [Musca autumnalis]|uniref:uncharacterized protein n=1 Tax=Musca autumnalis TaxID=221902 RepID=UPI003CEB28B5
MGRTANVEIWNYFDNYVQDGIAECKICSIRMRNNRVFNLRQHLRKVHSVDIEVQDATKRKMLEERQQGPTEKRMKRRAYIEVDKRLFMRSMIGLVVEDGIEPHIINGKNMANIIKPICSALSEQEAKQFTIDSNRIAHNIDQLASYIHSNCCKDLHGRLLSLKIDTDINASANTFCLSTQFIEEGQVETRLLGIIKLNEGETQFSEKHIQEILNKFDININQLVSVSWDHSKVNCYREVSNCRYQIEIEYFECYPDILIGNIRVEPYMSTIAHNCFMDLFKNPRIFQMLMECRNFAKFLNDESNGYYQIFEENNLKVPQVDSPWRWGSTYDMINDLFMARGVLQNTKFEPIASSEDQFTASDDMWEFISAYCEALKYLHKTLSRYSEEEQHIGDFYAQWLKCKLLNEKLVKKLTNKESFIGLIALELQNSIENRTKTLLEQDRFTGCLYLDPRFQHTLNLSQKMTAVEYLKKLWSQAKLYNPQMMKTTTADQQESAQTPPPPQQQFDDDEDEFLNDFLCNGIKGKDVTTADFHRHLEKLKLPFQMVDTNILFFWREWKFSEPELHYLSSICFAIPATQVHTKPRYSHIFTNTSRPNLSSERLLFIRLNSHLLDNAFKQVDILKEDDMSPSILDQVEGDDESLITPDLDTVVDIDIKTELKD